MSLPPPPESPTAPRPPGHGTHVAPPPGPPKRPVLSRAASVLNPEAQEQMIETLQREGAELEGKIREITAARSHGGHADVEDRLREDQLQAKAAMINKLQEELSEEVSRMEQGSNLKEEIHQYEAQRAALNREIQNAKDAMDHSDVGKLRDEVHRAEERCRQLSTQLQRLEDGEKGKRRRREEEEKGKWNHTWNHVESIRNRRDSRKIANSFLSKVDDRKEANMRISALEELLRGKTAEHQSQVDENMKAQHNRLMTIQEKQRVQARCLDLKQRNERLQIEITTQQTEMQKVEREMRLMRERLPPDNQEALEMALAEVVGSQGAAFARLDRHEGAVPSAEDLQGTGSMERVLERLGQERDDLRRQIAVLRMDLERETAVSKNFKALQDTRNPVAGGVVAVKDPKDQDILVAKLRIKLRLRYSIEELAEDYITRARVFVPIPEDVQAKDITVDIRPRRPRLRSAARNAMSGKHRKLRCNESLTLNQSFEIDGKCPGECPYHAMDQRHGMPSCTASCVVASQCALYNPDAPVPDQEVGTCRGALVDGLGLTFKSSMSNSSKYSSFLELLRNVSRTYKNQRSKITRQGCHRPKLDGTDTCLECASGYRLTSAGQCELEYLWVLYLLAAFVCCLVLLLLAYLLDLHWRPAINMSGLNYGLGSRSQQKYRDQNGELWPLSTNLCRTQVGGPGLLLHFNFLAVVSKMQ
eukprot:Skav209527  [mRNA]  locus=scaffold2767:416715:425255:- [translate_table: standard]